MTDRQFVQSLASRFQNACYGLLTRWICYGHCCIWSGLPGYLSLATKYTYNNTYILYIRLQKLTGHIINIEIIKNCWWFVRACVRTGKQVLRILIEQQILFGSVGPGAGVFSRLTDWSCLREEATKHVKLQLLLQLCSSTAWFPSQCDGSLWKFAMKKKKCELSLSVTFTWKLLHNVPLSAGSGWLRLTGKAPQWSHTFQFPQFYVGCCQLKCEVIPVSEVTGAHCRLVRFYLVQSLFMITLQTFSSDGWPESR